MPPGVSTHDPTANATVSTNVELTPSVSRGDLSTTIIGTVSLLRAVIE